MDKLSLNYHLDGVGWAKARIQIANSHLDCDVSYYPNDALDCLAGALVELLFAAGDQCTEVDLESDVETTRLDNERTVLWPGEPWAHIWQLEFHQPDKLNVLVEFHEDYDGCDTASPDRSISGTCSFRQVTSTIVSVLESLLASEGIIGYRTQWIEYEFPLSHLLTLKRFLVEFSEQPITDAVKSALQVSNWQSELKMLADFHTDVP